MEKLSGKINKNKKSIGLFPISPLMVWNQRKKIFEQDTRKFTSFFDQFNKSRR